MADDLRTKAERLLALREQATGQFWLSGDDTKVYVIGPRAPHAEPVWDVESAPDAAFIAACGTDLADILRDYLRREREL